MRYRVKNTEAVTLLVSLEEDGDDVDIVVTNKRGEEIVIAYLNEDGLTLHELDHESGIDRDAKGYIKHQGDSD